MPLLLQVQLAAVRALVERERTSRPHPAESGNVRLTTKKTSEIEIETEASEYVIEAARGTVRGTGRETETSSATSETANGTAT